MASIEDDWVLVPHPEDEYVHQTPSISRNKCLDPGLPLPNPSQSSWLIPPDPLYDWRSSKSLPQEIFDVVIIGSGFSGTSVAWHLLHERDCNLSRSKLKVLMLDAREVCSGATGRNGSSSARVVK